jgi:hypothetical protein
VSAAAAAAAVEVTLAAPKKVPKEEKLYVARPGFGKVRTAESSRNSSADNSNAPQLHTCSGKLHALTPYYSGSSLCSHHK